MKRRIILTEENFDYDCVLDPMRMMLNKVEFEFSQCPWPVYKTTLRPALKLLCHIKVDVISI